jgi:hypothetical protein
MSDLTVVVAHSKELDSSAAARELVADATSRLAGVSPIAGIVFAGIDADHQVVVDTLLEAWPELELIGCTTDGELSSVAGYAEDSLVLTLFASDTVEIVAGSIDNTAADLASATAATYAESIARLETPPTLCILISDAQRLSGELVMEHLAQAAGGGLPILGGISADSWRFEQSKQFCNGTVSETISPYLLFAGPLALSFGIDSGWETIGELGVVTRAAGNVVYEIDGRPALDFYKAVLGEPAVPSMELPIAVYDKDGRFRFLRTSLENYDRETGSVTFLGAVPEDHRVSMTVVSRDSIIAGAANAVVTALAGFPAGREPALALCFTCSARRALLGSRTAEEQQQVVQTIGDAVPVAGFYTYGEFCPRVEPLTSEFHNETFVALLVG